MAPEIGWRYALIIGTVIAAIAGMIFVDPIPQDPGYHLFADRGRLLGVANFWNVATNLPFLIVGLLGLVRLPRLASAALRTHYVVLCFGVALVAVGSAYYHLEPSTPALSWDRLPMTVAFMALLAAVFGDRISQRVGHGMQWSFVALGIASIAWWSFTEMEGRGDLRPYALVQFLPMLLIPMMLLLLPKGAMHAVFLWTSFGAYVGAKLAEHFDGAILDATGVFGGHSLKHLLAALGAWFAIRAFQKSPARAL
jgi:hypothetical protein